MRQVEHVSFGFPRPGKALIALMAVIFCVWVMFALALNWGGASQAVISPFLLDVSKTLHGQIWRLVTAPWIHNPGDPWHVVTTVLVLYFFGTYFEERWGMRRLVAFLFGSAALAFAFQIVVGLAIPKLSQPVLFGGIGMATAITVAWSLANRGSEVRLFFVLPVTGTMLLIFIFVMSLLYVIAPRPTPEGLITPFGGMLAGYLFSDVSPLRRFYLRRKLRRMQVRASGLRIVHGGASRPKDKRWLN